MLSISLAPAVSLRGADPAIEPIVSRIPREAVEASGIAAVGYSKRLHALEIEFRRGGTYRYLEVPASLHRDLVAAESKTRFYNSAIKGRYHCLRVRAGRIETRRQ